ncbi:MAG TPA: PAS domain-containing protein [bacterium]|nr:PAS domain-containing protein [bacterium]
MKKNIKKSVELIKKREEDLKELKETRKALMNMLEDVDESLSRAEEEKNKTLAIITNLTDGLLFFDKKNNLSLINPQAENYFRIKDKNLINKSFTDLFKIPNLKSLTRLLKEFSYNTNKQMKEIFRKELIIRKDLVLEVSVIPLVGKEKKIGSLIILHDITRKKIIERMKTEFISVAAHQLRTPLSEIKWTLKMFLDKDLGELTKEQQDFIKNIYLSNEKMVVLVNNLLNVSKIEDEKYLYKFELINIEKIIKEVIRDFQGVIKKKKIKLEFKKPKNKLPKLKLDKEKITLAIQNLLGNAIRYTLPNGKVTVLLKNVKKEIEFSIKDTGIGIPITEQKKIFIKFFRAANAIIKETEGSGLGLFIVKNIIEAHNGKIWFESEEKKGTTFFFTLPIPNNSLK